MLTLLLLDTLGMEPEEHCEGKLLYEWRLWWWWQRYKCLRGNDVGREVYLQTHVAISWHWNGISILQGIEKRLTPHANYTVIRKVYSVQISLDKLFCKNKTKQKNPLCVKFLMFSILMWKAYISLLFFIFLYNYKQ